MFDLRGVGSTLPQLGHLKLSQDVPPVILVLKSLNTLVSVEDSQFSRPDVRWTAFPLVGSLISFYPSNNDFWPRPFEKLLEFSEGYYDYFKN